MTASTTNCRSAKSAKSVVNASRAMAASRSSSASLPDRTPRSRLPTMRARPRSHASASTSSTSTSSPARAHTSAMPEPISPAPTTPTRSIVMSSSLPQLAPCGHIASGDAREIVYAGDGAYPARRDFAPPRSPAPPPSASPCGSPPTPCATSAPAIRGCSTTRSSRCRPPGRGRATWPWCSTTIASSPPSACTTRPAPCA